MKNLATKFILPVIVILFSGYSQLCARGSQGNISSLAMNSDKLMHFNFENNQMIPGLFLKLNQSPEQNSILKLRATDNEVEEEETISAKKGIVANNYFSSYYSTLSTSNFTSYIKKRVPFKTPLYYFSSCKIFVIYQVFRL